MFAVMKTGTKNSNFVEDHPRNIPAKFGSNRPSGFGEEANHMLWLAEISKIFYSETNELTEPKL
jgi:hypothetical protein